MKDFVLAVDDKGNLSKCYANEENRGKGRCNHIMHAKPNETTKHFLERAANPKIINKTVIYDTMTNEYIKIINGIENDFSQRLKEAERDWTKDPQLLKASVLSRMIDSRTGYMWERLARTFVELKYGKENVPDIINTQNIDCSNIHIKEGEQLITTNIDIYNPDLQKNITDFMHTNRGHKTHDCTVTQETIKELLKNNQQFKTNKIFTKPVDLAFYDGKNWNIFEIKKGGGLDSSNAPANISKLLTIYAGMNAKNTNIYYATIYNKNGYNKTWTGAVKQYLAYPEMFKIDTDFWDTLLPDNISSNEMKQMWTEARNNKEINKQLNKLLML